MKPFLKTVIERLPTTGEQVASIRATPKEMMEFLDRIVGIPFPLEISHELAKLREDLANGAK